MPALGVVIAWLAQLVTSETAKAIAWKAIAYTLLVVTFPIVLKGVFWAICDVFLSGAPDAINTTSEGIHGGVYTMVGLMGWLAMKLKLPECLGIYLGALSAKVALRMLPLPFIRIVR